MNETQIDTFIEEILQEMETLRYEGNKEITLTGEQERDLEKLSPSHKSDRKKEYLAEANERRKDRLSLLVSALEERIQASDLPENAKEQLLKAVDQAKDTNWHFSPQAMEKVEEIKANETAEKEEQARQQDRDILGAVIMGASLASATTMVINEVKNKEIPHTPQTIAIHSEEHPIVTAMGGTFMLPENAREVHPEYVEKVEKVGQKALEKIETKEPLTLDKITAATHLLPVEKRYATATFLEANPAIKHDKINEMKALKDKAVEKSIARHERKHNGKKYAQQNKRPNYSPAEALVMKRVNAIKQKAGTVLSMDEIKAELKHPALIRIFETRMKQEHPEFTAEQDKLAHKKEVQARLRSIRRHYRHNTLQDTLRNAQENEHETEGSGSTLQTQLARRVTVPETGLHKTLRRREGKIFNRAAINRRKKSVA